MAAIDQLLYRQRRWRFLLEVAGLGVRYFTGRVAPPTKALDSARAAAAGNYVDRASIAQVRTLSAKLDPLAAIVEGAGMQVVLATRGRDGDRYDPGKVLGSVGTAGASWSAQLIQTAECELATANLYVDNNPTGLSYPRRFHLADETVWATGAAGAGTAGDPWRITGVTRGVMGTLPRRHLADTETGDQPLITSDEIVHWDGRRVTLFVVPTAPDGTWLTDGTFELLRGVINGEPRIAGSNVTLQLVPHSTALDVELSSQHTATGLVHGWHYWAEGRATAVQHIQYFRKRAAYRAMVWAASNTGTQDVFADTTTFDLVFDVAGLPAGHPRHGRLAGVGDPVGPTSLVAVNQFEVPPNYPSRDLGVEDEAYNDTAAELRVLELVDTSAGAVLGEWPQTLYDAINDTTSGWAVGLDEAPNNDNHKGPDGTWIGVRIDPSPRGHRLVARHNCAFTEQAGGGAQIVLFPNFVFTEWVRLEWWRYDSGSATWSQSPGPQPPHHLWFAFDVADPSSGHFPEFHAAVGLLGDGVWQPREVRIPGGEEEVVIPIRDIALAWYQAGERYVLVEEAPPVLGVAAAVGLRIEYYDRATDSVKTIHTRAIGSTEVLHPDTGAVLGYALELDRPEWEGRVVPSFGDWPGRPRTKITAVIEWRGARDYQVLLQMMLSTAGQLVASDTYDVLPFGAGLGDGTTALGSRVADVDVQSFKRVAAPREASVWTFRHDDGDTIRDVLQRVLLATGTAMVLRRDRAGRARLARIKLGIPNKVEAVRELEVLALRDEPPESGGDAGVRNLWEIEANHDEEGEPQLKIAVRDQASIRLHGGAARKQEIDLRGLRLPDVPREAATSLLPLLSRLFRLHGRARRTWRVTVPTADALLLEVGTVVLVSSDFLWGEDARNGPGVSEVPARVLDVSLNFDTEGADVLLVSYGGRGTGWNAVCQVTANIAADIVEVAANAYRSTPHPRTGLAVSDLDYFDVDDAVAVSPTGGHDFAVIRTITAIDRVARRITLDGAHGLGALLGRIKPAPYDTPAASRHKNLAYIADSAGTLGAAGVGGDTFS